MPVSSLMGIPAPFLFLYTGERKRMKEDARESENVV